MTMLGLFINSNTELVKSAQSRRKVGAKSAQSRRKVWISYSTKNFASTLRRLWADLINLDLHELYD